jgi:uncharacterized protein (TIGR02001 family)
MNKMLLALASSLAFAMLPQSACAEDSPTAPAAAASEPAAAPADPLSFNIGAVTDYRYRGISQTHLKPAVQGGIDYAFASGLYVGTWMSNIEWIKDWGRAAGVNVGRAPLEWDLYGGYKGEIMKDLTYDVGALVYYYPTNHLGAVPDSANADTAEIYGALTYSIVTVKYSHAVTNLFGFANSKNSGYLEAVANVDLGNGFSVAPHIGHQRVAGTTPGGVDNSYFSYTDYSVTGAKDFGNGWAVTLAAVGTSTKSTNGVAAYAAPNDPSKNLGKTTVVLGVKKTF